MIKSKKMKIILILLLNIIINEIKCELITSKANRSWLYPCAEAKCTDSIDACIEKKCLGRKQCTECIRDDDYDCTRCVNEIFSKLNLINGEFICFINDPLQEKACQLYCRGQFQINGKCERNEKQIPRCLCDDVKQTSTTALNPATTTNGIDGDIKCEKI
jgi:hypothetical protein